jgi:hypothetical protein
VQGHEDPVSWAGGLLIRLGDPWVAAYFTGQLSQPGVPGGEHLMIEAPQQVGTPFAEIYYPWSEPIRMEGHAQRVDRRYEQVVGNIVQQNAGTFVARDHVPSTVDDKGGIGLVAFEQPLNGIPDISHV